MKNLQKVPPPPRFVGRKGFVCAICALLCIVFAFALVGCGSGYTDEDDYANFVKWQARYETEKELVGLLREYDAAYTTYVACVEREHSTGSNTAVSIAFVFEGRTILTDDNMRRVETIYDATNGYAVVITFDTVGTAIFAEFTANHIGDTLDIVAISDGSSSVISSPYINAAITDGRAIIHGNFTTESANDLSLQIASKNAERMVQQAAVAYNTKRSESSTRYSMPEYLPASLAVEPQYVDVSAYLQKAEAVGFTA